MKLKIAKTGQTLRGFGKSLKQSFTNDDAERDRAIPGAAVWFAPEGLLPSPPSKSSGPQSRTPAPHPDTG